MLLLFLFFIVDWDRTVVDDGKPTDGVINWQTWIRRQWWWWRFFDEWQTNNGRINEQWRGSIEFTGGEQFVWIGSTKLSGWIEHTHKLTRLLLFVHVIGVRWPVCFTLVTIYNKSFSYSSVEQLTDVFIRFHTQKKKHNSFYIRGTYIEALLRFFKLKLTVLAVYILSCFSALLTYSKKSAPLRSYTTFFGSSEYRNLGTDWAQKAQHGIIRHVFSSDLMNSFLFF